MKNFVQTGDDLTFLASELVHPTNSPDYPNAGDPVVCGRVVGVVHETAAASTDSVVVATRGVFTLTVASVHNGIAKGETVYIDPSTAVVSDDLNDVPFGVALGTVAAGDSKAIPVKLFGCTPGASGANS
jgi:predicted RecA/RadA family phage recombinase